MGRISKCLQTGISVNPICGWFSSHVNDRVQRVAARLATRVCNNKHSQTGKTAASASQNLPFAIVFDSRSHGS